MNTPVVCLAASMQEGIGCLRTATTSWPTLGRLPFSPTFLSATPSDEDDWEDDEEDWDDEDDWEDDEEDWDDEDDWEDDEDAEEGDTSEEEDWEDEDEIIVKQHYLGAAARYLEDDEEEIRRPARKPTRPDPKAGRKLSKTNKPARGSRDLPDREADADDRDD